MKTDILNIELPNIYTEEIWKRCENKHHKQFIGMGYISWSQVETFKDKAGFNTGLLGKYEYILQRFLRVKFPDLGWGEFGGDVEDYVTLKTKAEKFTAKERETMDKIMPLGVFQEEVIYHIEGTNVIVLGFIDDRSKERAGKIKMLRDYKTKSESSKKDLHLDKKHQIEIYVLGLQQRGLEVQNAEYCVIERFGGRECMMGGGRESLTVGERIWTEPYTFNNDRLEITKELLKNTAMEISKTYKTFQKLFA